MPYISPDRSPPRQGNWNYGQIIAHVDAIDVQIQDYVVNVSEYGGIASNLSGQMQPRPNGTLLFLQLALAQGNLQQNEAAFSSIQGLEIDGIVLFHSSSQLSDVESFLKTFR